VELDAEVAKARSSASAVFALEGNCRAIARVEDAGGTLESTGANRQSPPESGANREEELLPGNEEVPQTLWLAALLKSRLRDLNPGPPLYESGALPLS
jgi:hypothetical protein